MAKATQVVNQCDSVIHLQLILQYYIIPNFSQSIVLWSQTKYTDCIFVYIEQL